MTTNRKKRKAQRKKVPFRKEDFEILYHYLEDTETGEEDEDEECIQLNHLQVYNQYRAKYNLPFADEIRAIREKYEISAAKMSDILGFGINQYRNYEKGEIPSLSNGRLIQMIKDPEEFRKIITLGEVSQDDENINLKNKVDELIQEKQKKWWRNLDVTSYLVGSNRASEETGFVKPDLEKFCNMVLYFAEATPSFKTKMNKLMFYADFLNYKKSCFSISGSQYRAIQFGPVPQNFESLYEFAVREQYIEIKYITTTKGDMIERHLPSGIKSFNASLFSEVELDTLNQVVKKFKDTSTKDIVNTSHEEDAWKEYEVTRGLISYQKAFTLKAL